MRLWRLLADTNDDARVDVTVEKPAIVQTGHGCEQVFDDGDCLAYRKPFMRLCMLVAPKDLSNAE